VGDGKSFETNGELQEQTVSLELHDGEISLLQFNGKRWQASWMPAPSAYYVPSSQLLEVN
jgi:hypothetical protein